MKFEYGKDKVETRECVAYAFHMDGKPEQIGIVYKLDNGKAVWHYHDGYIDPDGEWEPEIAIHKFYTGDSVTITF